MPAPEDADLARARAILRDPATIRARSNVLLARAVEGRSEHFAVDLWRLDDAAAYVAAVIRDAYPSLDIPYHARWRHFAAGGRDRWGALAADLAGTDPAEIARIRFDLCVVSVLLDAGAGPDWYYTEPDTGEIVSRSEGLAVASLRAFRTGLFSGDPGRPLRADGEGLAAITAPALARAFQAGPANPLVGLTGRVALLRALGKALSAHPDLFGKDARVGGLYDALVAQQPPHRTQHPGHRAQQAPHPVQQPSHPTQQTCHSAQQTCHPRAWPEDPRLAVSPTPGSIATAGDPPPSLPAPAILAAVLDGLGPIWPDRLHLGGKSLGDVWRHPAIEAPDATNGLIPFHKLSQWLAYSLVEVLEDAGLRVTDLDALTGLPEYRNGGLFLDLDVIRLRDPSLAARSVPVSHPAIVEWRALTVALLDRIADPIRTILGCSAADLPLARMLEGGTWAAGRRVAKERRVGAVPPLTVLSDGTVF